MLLLFCLLPIPFLIAAICYDELDFVRPYARVILLSAITILIFIFASSKVTFWTAVLLSLLVFVVYFLVDNWIGLLLPVFLLYPTKVGAGFLLLAMIALGALQAKKESTWLRQVMQSVRLTLPIFLIALLVSFIV